MDIQELYWLAGFLEGEGCFSIMRPKKISQPLGCSPVLTVSGTDLDTLTYVHKLLKSPNPLEVKCRPNPKHKTVFVVTLRGKLAISWMLTLWPLMRSRRRARIIEVVKAWRLSPGLRKKRNASCHPDRPHKARSLCPPCYANRIKS